MKIDPMKYEDAEKYCTKKGMKLVEGLLDDPLNSEAPKVKNFPSELAEEAKYFGIASHWVRGRDGDECNMRISPKGDGVRQVNCNHVFDVICINQNYLI